MKPQSLQAKISSQAVGAAGELIVQARLLMRGWSAGNLNTGGMMNATAIDIVAAKGAQTVRIAVKTTGLTSSKVNWNARFGWKSLFKGDAPPNFVIFVWFHDRKHRDDCRIFVVPAEIVNQEVRSAHLHWHSQSKRDGGARKVSNRVAIDWLGRDTEGSISRNFAAKWQRFEDKWSLLEQSHSHSMVPGGLDVMS